MERGRASPRSWNYLRVRGEYLLICEESCTQRELPPRARRIPAPPPPQVGTTGTTSACAENTGTATPTGGYHGNYLRVRGEYLAAPRAYTLKMELPPRARRIQWRRASRRSRPGTTSACAENTADDEQLRPMGRNYLRVRGEYPRNYDMCHIVKELPPRARRIRRYRQSG